MKKLMIAASVAAVGLAAFADVYNVKFTATTIVDADGEKAKKKVKGEEIPYYKKGTVTINGVYDNQDGKYYFWSGSGKTMKAIPNAVFELTNDTDMDSDISGKNYAVNVGFYIGSATESEGVMQSYFVSGGIGKVNTLGGSDLASASGSFGGTWFGYPAYGSWSWSKNSTATKNGIDAYVNQQGKTAGVDTSKWNVDNALFKEKIDAWRNFETVTAETEALIKEVAELTGLADELEKTVEDQERELELKSEAIVLLEAVIAEDEGEIADLQEKLTEAQAALESANKTIEEKESTITTLNEAIDGLNGRVAELSQTIEEQGQTIEEQGQTIKEQEAKIAEYEGLIAILDEIVAQKEAEIADLTAKLETSDAKVAELKAALDQLNNSAEVVGLISAYLKDQIEQNQAIVDDATLAIEQLSLRAEAYEIALSDDFEEALRVALEDAKEVEEAKEADAAAKLAAYEEAAALLQDYQDIKDALEIDGFEYYKGINEGMQQDVRDEADAQIADLNDQIAAVIEAYDLAIVDITAKSAEAAEFGLDNLVYYVENGENKEGDDRDYETLLPHLVTVKAAQDALDAAQAILQDANGVLADAEAILARYTTEEGSPNLDQWCEDFGYDKNSIAAQEAFAEAYAEYESDVRTAQEDVKDAQDDVDDAETALGAAETNLEALKAFRDEAKAAYEAGELDSHAKELAAEKKAECEQAVEELTAEIGNVSDAADKRIQELQDLLEFARNQSVASITEKVEEQTEVTDAAEEAKEAADEALVEAIAAREEAQARYDNIDGVIAECKQALEGLLENGIPAGSLDVDYPERDIPGLGYAVDVGDKDTYLTEEGAAAMDEFRAKFEDYKTKAEHNVKAAEELIAALEKAQD